MTAENTLVWYIAPTYKQAKMIAWKMLNSLIPREAIAKSNDSELIIYLKNGSEICLKGADNPDSLRGVGLDFAVLDEYGQMDESVWVEVVRPMLIDTGGQALFIGTPAGFNHFYDIYNKEKKDTDFMSFHFTTKDNLAIPGIAEEVDKAEAEATSELDKIKFSQEYMANFEVLTGVPYFDIGALKAQKRCEPIGKYDIFDLYERPKPGIGYILGGDPAEGLDKGDNTSVFVINRHTLDVVAEYTGKLAPDVLALKVKIIGEYFNNAFSGIEVNNHGLTTLTCLKPIYSYLYYRKIYDEITKRWTPKLGWQTNTKTRFLMLDNLAKLVRERSVNLRSGEAINELMTFTIVDGKAEAQLGCLDDRVISLAIAYQMINETSIDITVEEKKSKRHSVDWSQRRMAHEAQGCREKASVGNRKVSIG